MKNFKSFFKRRFLKFKFSKDYLLYKKINPCDMCVILLQNKLSREKYTINLDKDIQKHWK